MYNSQIRLQSFSKVCFCYSLILNSLLVIRQIDNPSQTVCLQSLVERVSYLPHTDSKIQRFKIYSAFNPKHIGL